MRMIEVCSKSFGYEARSLGSWDFKVLSSDGIGGEAAPAKFGGFNATHHRSRRDPNLM